MKRSQNLSETLVKLFAGYVDPMSMPFHKQHKVSKPPASK